MSEFRVMLRLAQEYHRKRAAPESADYAALKDVMDYLKNADAEHKPRDLETWLALRFARYRGGGITGEQAARFVRGELEALYSGNHYSAGGIHTPPPEPMEAGAALKVFEAFCDTLKNTLPGKEANQAELTFTPSAADRVNALFNPAPDAPKTGRISSVEGPGLNAPGDGQGITPPAQADAPRTEKPTREGLAALLHMVEAGMGIKDFYARGEDNNPASYLFDADAVRRLWDSGKREFKMYLRGWLVIDIDRKPGKTDGVEIFYSIYNRSLLPTALQNLENGEPDFPCYTKSPSNGYHLFFKYAGEPMTGKHNIHETIEIKTQQIRAGYKAGDLKNPYVLHGDLKNAPRLAAYKIIMDKIPGISPGQETAPAPQRAAADRPYRATPRPGGTPLNPFNDSLDDVYKRTVEKRGAPKNEDRNRFCYDYSVRAGIKGYTDKYAIYNFLEGTPAKTDDMMKAIESGLTSKAVQDARIKAGV
ncbi:hypothetical protein FACS189479_04910 [Spirochaetia bacterium]|nr:hypothetical protein FACS189479_04910 [Spirochaetia bacterium]